MRSVWLPSGHIPLREPPCPERQVGEGDAPLLMLTYFYCKYPLKSISARFSACGTERGLQHVAGAWRLGVDGGSPPTLVRQTCIVEWTVVSNSAQSYRWQGTGDPVRPS